MWIEYPIRLHGAKPVSAENWSTLSLPATVGPSNPLKEHAIRALHRVCGASSRLLTFNIGSKSLGEYLQVEPSGLCRVGNDQHFALWWRLICWLVALDSGIPDCPADQICSESHDYWTGSL